jgi:hypothetical protein
VLKRAEEQGQMIESLHTSVAMYKRLYEEEQKLHSSDSRSSDLSPGSTSMHYYEFTALCVLRYPLLLTSWLSLIELNDVSVLS